MSSLLTNKLDIFYLLVELNIFLYLQKKYNMNFNYEYQSYEDKDGHISREFNVCNLLLTNDVKRNTKILLYK